MIAAVDHLGSGIAAVDDDDVFQRSARFDIQGCVDIGFEGGGLTSAIAGVGGDDELGFGVFATIGDGVGRKAAEDHWWATPMRVQASIAIGSSSTIGM